MKKHVLIVGGLALLAAGVTLAQQPVPLNALPSRIAGHLPESLPVPNQWPNLVEGREMWQPRGVALDTSVSPPSIYVSDYLNNRVLGWKNAAGFRNGQPADLVLGQPDFVHTGPLGPGSTFSAGFNSPAGLLVDAGGNLYVADTLNNRILRFPKPFAQQNGQSPDLYIGQPNLSSKAANYTGAVSDQGLSLSNAVWPTNNMAFDSDRNLWVVDGGNRRVLRFASSDLAAGGGPLRANLQLGQLDFNSVQPNVTNATRTTTNVFALPSGIAFDAGGNLYVSDGLPDRSIGRVLVFKSPFTSAQSAARLMGVFPTTAPSQDAIDKTVMTGPTSVFFAGGKMGVVDSLSHRILLFDTFDKWPDQSAQFSPQATGVFGQPDFHNRALNATLNSWVVAPTASTLSGPFAAVVAGSELFVADTGNNRVVVLPITGSGLASATRVLGQDNFTMSAANLVEGREFAFLQPGVNGSLTAEGAGVAIDETADTPHLYVADTYNHRVLGFKDFRKVQGGAKADIVIGQPDMNSNLCNVSGNPDGMTASSLCLPMDVVVDSVGDLYVSDALNGRMLRFPAPFAHQGQPQQADLVLGQRTFTTKNTDPSNSTMATPYGLAISPGNGLFVSDVGHHRVLYFPFTGNASFAAGSDNGRPAAKVFGQQDFTSVLTGNTDAAMNAPRHISTDNEARLYVADTGNNRVLIFDQINLTPTTGAHATFMLSGLSQPRAVFVNQGSSEMWVAEGTAGVLKRYPRYANLILNSTAPNCTGLGNCVQAGSNALSVTQDQYGDLIVADASSRVQFYYPGVQGFNGGHFLLSRPNLAPGLLTSLCSPASGCDPSTRTNLFGGNTAAAGAYPLPQNLGDVQVLFGPSGQDLTPAPLYYVSPSQINFVVPMGAPTSGFVDIQVVQPSTGRILAAGQAGMATNAPAILQLSFTGKNRQAAVVNLQDGTVNSPTNPAARGSFVSLYATGQGFVPGSPADGAAITGAFATPQPPRININGTYLDDYVKNTEDKPKDQWLQYSGLSSFPGLWQINFYIPSGVLPGTQIPILILAGNSATSSDGTIVMTIAVK
jgi:uncharacterized protein (TIGR03437 family)